MATVSLVSLVGAPLIAAAWIAWGCRWQATARPVAAASVIVQGLACAHLVLTLQGAARQSPSARIGWWALSFDGLAAPFVALTVVSGLGALAASWRLKERPRAHLALLMVLQAALATVFTAADLIVFYVGWEASLLPLFFLIAGWGSSGARRASQKFLVFTFLGGTLLLIGVVTAVIAARTSDLGVLRALGGVPTARSVVFWTLMLGMLVKLPAVGLHTWLPDAHTEAPTAGSIVLAAVVLKMAGYGAIRVVGPLAPDVMSAAGPALVGLGVLGAVWGAATALVQSDLKRLVAYSSIAHMGFVLAALGVGTEAARAAAVITMVSHGLVAGLLFFLVGALYERAHTRELAQFGGLGRTAPAWSVGFVFAALASAGLPGLSGFPGEFVTVIETFRVHGWPVVVLGGGIVLAAAYNLRAVRRVVHGPAGPCAALGDLDRVERATVAAFAVAILAIGLAPSIVTDGVLGALSAPVPGPVGMVGG